MASKVLKRLVTQKPMVTAGFKWPPEMCPMAVTIKPMARPCARAMPSRPRTPCPVLCRNWSAQMEPAPKKIRANVPMNSATSFWDLVYIERLRKLHQTGARASCSGDGRDSTEMRYASQKPAQTERASCRRGSGSARGGAHGDADGSQPMMAVGLLAADEGEEFILQTRGDFAALAFANEDVVHGTDGGNFGGCPDEEHFVGDVQHLAGDFALGNGNLQVTTNRQNAVARDARQDAGGERGRQNRSLVDQEEIHPRTFADETAGIEGDAFCEAIDNRFHADQLRVHVVGGGFGHRRQSVRSDARPRADADVHTLSQGVRAEVGTPFPAGHVHFNGIVKGVDVYVAVAAENDGTQIAG